jgi:hypothetical protein
MIPDGYPPIIRYSTLRAFNKAQSSAKSFWTSIVVRPPQSVNVFPPQPLDFRDPLFRWAAQPVGQGRIAAAVLLERCEAENPVHVLQIYHSRISAHNFVTGPTH